MATETLKFYNGRIITQQRILNAGCVLVRDGKIIYAGSNNEMVSDAREIDLNGKFLAPGFIDIHVHGGGDHDFMDGTVDAFLEIAKMHAKYGTTSMLPTTLSSTSEELLKSLEIYEIAAAQNNAGAEFLGMHLEGPYFAMSQRGAQDPRYIRNPDPAEYEPIIAGTKLIKRWSAAPELPGAIEFGKHLRKNNIIAALAHTDAIYEEAELAFENGYTLATHFYSAMSGVTRRNAYRYAGVVESAYLIDAMDVEIIADGVHLPAPLLRLIYKIKGPDRIALITDAMRGAGMPSGKSRLGSRTNGLDVILEDGVAKLPDRSSFAGSVATTDRLVRNMITMAGVPVVEAVRMMSATPARILNVDDRKGSILAGKDADLVVFDDQINVSLTMNRGKILFEQTA